MRESSFPLTAAGLWMSRSVLGEKRKCRRFDGMSALPHKTVINCRDYDVRFVPTLLQKVPNGVAAIFPPKNETSGNRRSLEPQT